jgi:hypothetical protein
MSADEKIFRGPSGGAATVERSVEHEHGAYLCTDGGVWLSPEDTKRLRDHLTKIIGDGPKPKAKAKRKAAKRRAP